MPLQVETRFGIPRGHPERGGAIGLIRRYSWAGITHSDMKKFTATTLLIAFLLPTATLAQAVKNHYEVELFANPNPGRKDTREVNAVLIFDNDVLRIESRRNKTLLKEFKYSELKSVEHSFSKNPLSTRPSTTAIILTVMTGIPVFLFRKEKHWLNIVSEKDFAVLKIENDNFRLIKNEFAVKDIDLANIDEDKQ
jgi:hypothetical protein